MRLYIIVTLLTLALIIAASEWVDYAASLCGYDACRYFGMG
jgi:hypothetical protein